MMLVSKLMRSYRMLDQKEQKVIDLIKEDISYNNYFFSKLEDVKWFFPLKERGFFSIERIPKTNSGDFQFWNVLDYLERVSEQSKQYAQYGKELIEIINNIVYFSLNTKQINNYHIWWYCIKIINNLPHAVIKVNFDVKKFRNWLALCIEHSTGINLIISDIAKMLLPKFLGNDYGPDYNYAETIIDVITKIKSGGNTSVITLREDVVFACNSYGIRDALHKQYQQIGQKCSLNVIYKLADRLKNALEFKQKNYFINIEIGNEVYWMRVSRVEQNSGEIGFETGLYQCDVRQYSREQLTNNEGQNYLWMFRNTEPQTEIKRFNFTALNKEMMFLAIKKNLPESINWASIEKLKQNLESIFDGLHSDYSHIWFKSVASSGNHHTNSANDVLTSVLRDILFAKCELNRQEGKKILDAFLSDKYLFPIFKRLVLFCVDKFWDEYSDCFNRFLTLFPNAFEKSEFEVELHYILLNHNQSFNKTIKETIKLIIENVPEHYISNEEDRTFFWKFKWLSPLRDHPDFKALYEDIKQKVAPKNGKPYKPEHSIPAAFRVVHKSPISKEEILQRPISELVKYLTEFKGAASWFEASEGEPDREGFADALEAAVTEVPEKFSNEIEFLFEIDCYYLDRLLKGFKTAWNNGKDLGWGKLFAFFMKYFGQERELLVKKALKSQGEDGGNEKYIWIVTDFVDLIADGCRDDKHAFAHKYFESVEKIFNLLFPLLEGEKHPDIQNNSLTYALNTTLGRAIAAYITFALRVARVNKTKEKDWGKNKYERFFEKGIEAYIWFGSYLPQIKYLDELYAKDKIILIAQKNADDFIWQSFMEGYLLETNVYRDIFQFMRLNYLKGLENKVFEEEVDQRLVEHICIGYLNDDELLEPKNKDESDSLFWIMLMKVAELKKPDRWEKIVDFFWSLSGRTFRKEDTDTKEMIFEKMRKRILEFWAWTVDQQNLVKTLLDESYNSFLGKLAGLTLLLDKIDEEKGKWLLLCAPHIELHHSSSRFIEYLTKFEDEESIKRIGKIFLKVLENTTPDYDPEDIKVIVRRIYERSERDDADAICNTYGRRGNHLLKPLWDEFQKKSESK